jgi:hypothetical protein
MKVSDLLSHIVGDSQTDQRGSSRFRYLTESNGGNLMDNVGFIHENVANSHGRAL